MTYKYNSTYVDIKNIKCDQANLLNTINQRTYLTLPLNTSGSNETISIILMNPSYADNTQSDKTINTVIDFCYTNNYKLLTILNLFPIYNTKSSALYQDLSNLKANNLLESTLLTNIQNFKLNLNSSKIVLAWGDCPKNFNATLYYNTISKILKLLAPKENIYCFKFNSNTPLSLCGNPYHPSRKPKITGLIPLKIDKFYTLKS